MTITTVARPAMMKDIALENKKIALLETIVQQTEGDMSTTYLTKIINTVDVNLDYMVHVTRDPKEFENTLTLRNYKRANTLAGSEGTEEFGQVIIGSELVLGERKSMESFGMFLVNNRTFDYVKPEFDPTKVNAVTIHRHIWNNLPGSGVPEFDSHFFILNIYVPRADLM